MGGKFLTGAAYLVLVLADLFFLSLWIFAGRLNLLAFFAIAISAWLIRTSSMRGRR